MITIENNITFNKLDTIEQAQSFILQSDHRTMLREMEIHSSIGRLSTYKPTNSGYQQLDCEFVRSGFTYKSNEILHKICENHPRHYPYSLLLHITKTFHFNQFQIIFFSHILNDDKLCYNNEPELFNDEIEISPEVAKIIQSILDQQTQNSHYSHQLEQLNIIIKNHPRQIKQEEREEREQYGSQNKNQFNTIELKKIYAYLLVLGYAVKYYLNEQLIIKPYDQEIKMRHPTFFASIFNRWAKKYGNTVLATTPRRINSYYMGLASQLEVEDNINNNNNQENCQYRNYNQIVEELIKATTEGQEVAELDREAVDNQ